MSNPELEDATWATIAAENARRSNLATQGTQQQAQRLGELHNLYPSLPAGVKLSAAKANLTDEQVRQIALASVPVDTQPKKPKQKSWFERNVMSKVKTASRYGFAGLEFVPQTVVGGVAQIFDTDDSVNGWIISTDLGSLIANDEEAGDGFFIGGRAKELQSERVRRYRGTINGEAYTIGRGLAATFLEPDTVAYRTLSGMVDAGVALAIPVVPLAKAVGKGARLIEEGADLAGEGLGLVGKGLTALSQTETGVEVISKYGAASRIVGKGSKEVTVTRATAEQRELLRQQVGIVGNSIDIEQTNRFFRTGFGRKIIQRTAETNDFAETHALWGGKLDPSTTMKLANAKTEEEVMASLLDVLGTQVTDISNVKGGRKVYMSLAQRNKIIDAIPISTQGVSRTFAKMPAHNINLFQAETPRDQIRQIDTVQRVLKLFKVAGPKLGEKGEVLLNDAGEVAVPDLAKDFINRAGELLLSKDETKIAEFYDDLLAEGKNSMVRFGTAPELVDELYKVHDGYVKGARKRTVDSAGNATDDGAYRRINGLPPDADARNYIGGTLSSEFAKNEFVVPDPRQVRRLTNNYNWLWVKNKKDPNLKSLDKAGQLRMPFSAASSFQEQVWRKYITATIGNFVRNTVDSQISIALSGKTGVSPFYHPFHWMSFVNHKVGQGTVTGKQWDVIGSVENIGDELVDYRNVTGDGLTAYYKDTLALRRRATRIGQFVPYERRLDKVDYAVARAHGDEIGKLNADWSTRRMAEGLSIDELFDLIQQGDKEAVRWFTTVKSRFKSGMEIWDAPSQSVVYQKIDMNVPGNLKRLMESNAERLGRITGGNAELLDVVAQGRLTKRVKLVGPKDKITGELKIGGRVQVTQKVFVNGKSVPTTFVGKVVDETRTAKGSTFKVEPFAFAEGDNTKELEELLRNKSIYMDPRMPKQVVGEIRNPQTAASNDVIDSLNLMVDKFYSFLYTKPIGTLERSPVFRNLYYEWVEKLSTSLDEQSLNKIIDDISSRTNEPEKYLTPGLWKKLQDLKANPDKLYGTLNADEVSSFASGSALDEYKKTFYNAVERRNGTDVLRLISPFAQQQAEFFGRMARFFTVPVAGGALGYLPNPENFRKIQFAVENGREADPDGDGRGIFYKDPSNGRFSVDIPIVGGLTKMATGVTSNLTLPLKGISPGLDYRPGLGPVMTMATSAILSDVPSQDWIRKFLLPYGERTDLSDAFVPSWITKVYEGITGKTDGRFFANTYVETMQALSATGEYDLSNANEIDRLKNDARDKARIFAVLRGVSQFTGPASGDFNMKVAAKGGDYHTVGLATALQALRENNPDTSALRFIEIFGDNAFMYLANKTTSEVGGLGASKEFGDFERNNPGLFSVYPEIGGFFGPAGTDFDFEVYTRQLKTGKRRRLTDDEIIDASQKAIGMAFYRDMKRYFGPKMNKDQRDYLANYKDQIIAKYPGFGKMNLDPEETNRDIGSLFDAAKRDDLQDNKVAQAVNYYEQVRNAALQEANRRGFDSLKSPQLGDLHEYLEGYAETLTQQSPDFAKVYDRLLSQEFE